MKDFVFHFNHLDKVVLSAIKSLFYFMQNTQVIMQRNFTWWHIININSCIEISF